MSAHRRKTYTPPFLALPQYVLRSRQFRTLSPPACKLLMAVGGEFRGDNNGELEMPFGELVRDWHYNSRSTISRALGELLRVGLLVRTLQGRRFGGKPTPSLYALAWIAIPASPRHNMHEIAPRLTPQVCFPGPTSGLDKPKQVQPLDLRPEKTSLSPPEGNEVMRVSQVHCSREQVQPLDLLSRSMPGSTHIDNAGKSTWPRPGSTQYAALVAKYCYFTIPFRTRAKIRAKAAA